MLRRVVVITADGCLTCCKPNGAVCRIVHTSQITHLVHAPDQEGTPSAWLLLRVQKEHDLLFHHVTNHADDGGSYGEMMHAMAVSQAANVHMGLLQGGGTGGENGGGGGKSGSGAVNTSTMLASRRQGVGNTSTSQGASATMMRGAGTPMRGTAAGGDGGGGGGLPEGFESIALFGGQKLASPTQLVDLLVQERSKVHGVPLSVAHRPNGDILIKAADVAKRPGFVKPQASSFSNQVFIPTVFDLFPIASIAGDGGDGGGASVLASPVDIQVDATFLEMLHRAMVLHPFAAGANPKVLVEPLLLASGATAVGGFLGAAGSFSSFQVSSSFLCAFVAAYDEHIPLVVQLQSQLPELIEFRASKKFWGFVVSRLRVSRPSTTALSMLSDYHVVVNLKGEGGGSPLGEGGHAGLVLSATLAEWNDTMAAWEAEVRNPVRSSSIKTVGGSQAGAGAVSLGGATGAGGNSFWKHFVEELDVLSTQLSKQRAVL